jgi:hypothetical protein
MVFESESEIFFGHICIGLEVKTTFFRALHESVRISVMVGVLN